MSAINLLLSSLQGNTIQQTAVFCNAANSLLRKKNGILRSKSGFSADSCDIVFTKSKTKKVKGENEMLKLDFNRRCTCRTLSREVEAVAVTLPHDAMRTERRVSTSLGEGNIGWLEV